MNKIIVIEGSDCSGKETQSKLLIERLALENIVCHYVSFPNYSSPTGKIIGGPYLGKSHICDGWFKEGATAVDPKVASLFYATDRLYNKQNILDLLKTGHVILDRYTFSNMAHQGGKIKNDKERIEMYKWLEKLEFDLINLPKPDVKIFLDVPIEISSKLRELREEKADQHESNLEYLNLAYKSYKEICKLYDFREIRCTKDCEILKREDIHNLIYECVKDIIC